MDNMERMLEGIGLSRGEAKVYLALLEAGQSTSGPIVKRSGISSSKVYEILGKLMKKGLVSTVTREGRRNFSAIEPKKLLEYLDEREAELGKQREDLKRMLPYFLEKKAEAGKEQKAEVAFGFKGLVGLANRLIEDGKKGDEYVFFSFYTKHPEKHEKVFNFYRQFDEDRKRKGLLVKGIVPRELKDYIGGRRYAKICMVDFPVPTNLSICGDKVLMTPWEDEPVSILIYSRQLAESFRGYFHSIFDKYYRA
jgi:predicted transcriptional regulator